MRALLALALLWSFPAAAQQFCAPRAVVLNDARNKFGEVPHSGGTNKTGTLFVELLLSPEGSWTIIMSRAGDRLVCVKASGTGWERLGGIPGESG